MDIITFEEAIAIANGLKNSSGTIKPRHILLGNGFSIACKPDIFTYNSLLENTNFSTETINKLFKLFKTQDFEQIIKVLQDSAKTLTLYNKKAAEIGVFKTDANNIKEELIRVLCEKHPERPSSITDIEYQTCAKFLSNFDRIFSLNYDLLLYWTLLQDKDGHKYIKKIDDGFRRSDKTYLHWNIEEASGQNIYYMHGALHLLDNEFDIIKLEWEEWGSTLLEQISNGLQEERFPLFVAEGTSKQKISKINHSSYLSKCLGSFANIGGNLFVYGHSLAENDEHILNLIPLQTSIENLFISIHGDPNEKKNKTIMKRAQNLQLLRSEKMTKNKKLKELNLYFYTVESTKVWS